MLGRAILLAGLLGTTACSAGPGALGITGPGSAAPASFKPVDPSDDSAVGLPGIQQPNAPFSNSLQPAGDAAKPGSFYGYN